MQTIIMAGGKGTRIQSIASDIPKLKVSGAMNTFFQCQEEKEQFIQ